MLFAVTSSIVWWFLMPLIAANIARIMVRLLPLAAAGRRRGRVGRGASGPFGGPGSCDDGAVDVGEDVVAHMGAVDGGDYGPVGDRDDEGVVVDHHHRLAAPLAGGE